MKCREVHVTTRNGNYHKFRNCEVIIDRKFILIKEGYVDNIFPVDGVEVISSLKEKEEGDKNGNL